MKLYISFNEEGKPIEFCEVVDQVTMGEPFVLQTEEYYTQWRSGAPAQPSQVLTVTRWQMRRAINQLGMRPAVDAFIATAPLDIKDAWECAEEFRRDHPLIQAVAAAFGMTEQQLDDLFTLAATFQ